MGRRESPVTRPGRVIHSHSHQCGGDGDSSPADLNQDKGFIFGFRTASEKRVEFVDIDVEQIIILQEVPQFIQA
jgi:hypothetical protein